MDLSLESTVGKYGLFWINYLMDTNYNLYIRLKNDIEQPLYKMAKEIHRRIVLMIEQILSAEPHVYYDHLVGDELTAAKKIRFMQAEEIALHEIIYNK